MKIQNTITRKINLPKFCQKNDINYFGVFGSFARGDTHEKSDIDILVDFDKAKCQTLFGLARIQTALEKKLGKEVDLVLKNSIKKRIKPYIKKDLITLYEKRS